MEVIGGGGTGVEVVFIDGDGNALAATMPHLSRPEIAEILYPDQRKYRKSQNIGRSTDESDSETPARTYDGVVC